MKTIPLSIVLASLSLGACGGIVSLGDPGSGSGQLGAGDAGADGTSASTTGDASADSSLGEWPWCDGGFCTNGPEGAVDAAVGTMPISDGQLNAFVWLAWWPCGGATCTQYLQLNAECNMEWVEARTDSDKDTFHAAARISDARCKDIFDNQKTFSDMVDAPDPAVPATGLIGAEELRVMTGPSPGTWKKRRIDPFPTAGTPFGLGRKLLFSAYLEAKTSSPMHFADGTAGPASP